MLRHIYSLPSQQLSANRFLWDTIALVIFFEFLAIYLLGLKIDAPAASGAFVIMGVCISIAAFYRYIRRDDSISLFANAFNLLICGSFAISIGTYLGAYMAMPLTDKTLIALDGMMGFNWQNYVAWVDQYPFIASIMTTAYNSCGIQFIILLPLLFYNQTAHAQRVFMVLYFSGLMTVLLSALFPAVAGYIYYNVDITKFHNVPSAARIHEQLFLGLHDRTINTIPYPGVGIVTFPSYHTAVGMALIYGSLPYRFLFPISVLVNVILLLSTPFDGGHYLTDVIGGIIITIVAIYLAEQFLPRSSLRKRVSKAS